jgi:hypothetical protein
MGGTAFTPEQDRHYVAISTATIHGRRLRREQLDVIWEGEEVSLPMNARA